MKKLFLIIFCTANNAIFSGEIQVFFSPSDNVSKHLLEKIKQAKKSIDCAIYMFTDKNIAHALVQAANSGVKVSIVVDKCSVESKWGKCGILLEEKKIKVFVKKEAAVSMCTSKSLDFSQMEFENDQVSKAWLFPNQPIMHNKYIIFDQKDLWTGSFNFTLAANNRNSENAVCICGYESVVRDFYKNFQFLLSNSVPLTQQMLLVATSRKTTEELSFATKPIKKDALSLSFYTKRKDLKKSAFKRGSFSKKSRPKKKKVFNA